jgi:hypothetical protein
MKTHFFSKTRNVSAVVVAAIGLLALAPDADARDRGHPQGKGPSKSLFSKGKGKSSHSKHGHHDDDRRRFFAHPRSGYKVTLGNGYAGRGYYYGPPNASYYYQGSGVSYYSTRERVPHHYWGRQVSYRSNEMAVQRALAQRGYYRGPIDGVMGPGSRDAVARYQRDRRLAVTGNVNTDVLRSLGLL